MIRIVTGLTLVLSISILLTKLDLTMQTIDITKKLDIIKSALEWEQNVPQSERLSYRQRLINIRRELKKIQYAVAERPSVAAFGESQMGKSYLVSALMSTPSKPFCVTDGSNSYNFIDEINPSSPNSTIEATGVITRFTTEDNNRNIPSGYLRAQLLSVSDVVLMLCEAYYNQVDYSHESILDTELINNTLNGIIPSVASLDAKVLSVDDIADIQEYLQNSSIQKKCHAVLSSNLFNYITMNIDKLGNAQVLSLMKLLWNNNIDINRVFDDLMSVYSELGYSNDIYVRFDSVLKKHGTLLDVARLDEMYGTPEVVGSEYTPSAQVLVGSNLEQKTLKKSFFSALIAELTFNLPKELNNNRDFLKDLDILDFPGARRPEQIKEGKLNEGKYLSTVLRRGKVSYLFNKYSSSKRISTLMFCHNNNQSAESTMGALLTNWVNKTIGESPLKRETFIKKSQVSPLFIIGTWFNKDLDYQNEITGNPDRLNERWQRRFNVVLEKEVLKSVGDSDHWFNNWTNTLAPFQNIYMLRDFKYSTGIFKGYDPDSGSSESEAAVIAKYPEYLQDLRMSFITNEFVRTHFAVPSQAWDEAASVGQDGTSRIISGLCSIAPNVSNARNEKFSNDYSNQVKNLISLLEQYYHPDSSDEQLKLAKKLAGSTCLMIDKLNGQDPYFFSNFLDKMMFKESEIYEVVHKQLLGAKEEIPMSGVESSIFMGAGLDSTLPREENISRLCDYLGVDDEEECRSALIDEDVDMDNLLSHCQMVSSRAGNLVAVIENLWHEKFLIERCSEKFKDVFPAISGIVSNLWSLYQMLQVHGCLESKINTYLQSLDQDVSVGIISDYLAMQLNSFVNSFGYDFMTEEIKQNIIKQNEQLHLNLNDSILNIQDKNEGVTLLADLYTQQERLSQPGFNSQDRQFLLRFPQYSKMWKWQQQLRVGYIYSCSLPDYDVKANEALKKIIDAIK